MFEPREAGFAFYQHAFAKGIEVSAEEREIYLSGAHIDWITAIYGREPNLPRRRWVDAVKRQLLATLRGFDVNSPD